MELDAEGYEIEEGRYECPICAARSVTVGDKKRHIRETHPEVRA